jgi:PAS domain S-box-containing protein
LDRDETGTDERRTKSVAVTRDTGEHTARPTREHLVHFYEEDAALAASVSKFLADGYAAGDALVAITTDGHRRDLHEQLEARGVDVARACDAGQLTFVDAAAMLSKITRDGQPVRALFEAEVGGLITQAAARQRDPQRAGLRAYGEMVDLLWRGGQRTAAILLEELWSELQSRCPFTLLCAYSMASLYKESYEAKTICGVHTHVLGTDPASSIDESERAIDLGPKGAPDLANEIAKRREVERALRQTLREQRVRHDEIWRTQSQLQAITDALPVLVAYVDASQRYQFVSAAYERWFGHPKEELIGRHLEEVLGPDAYRAIHPNVERALSGEALTFEAELPYSRGGTRWVEATYLPQRGADGTVTGFVSLVADVTERVGLERFRTLAATRAEKLSAITAALAGAVTREQVFDALVGEVSRAVEASSAGLWLLDADGRTTRLVHSLGYNDAAQRAFAAMPLDTQPSIPALDVMRTGEPLFIASQQELLRSYPHLHESVTPGRSYRVSCLPLTASGRVLGVLAVTIEDARTTSDDERGFLLLVARYASQAVERLRSLEAERASRARADAAARRLADLYRFAQAVVAANQVEQVFDAAFGAIESVLGTTRAAILTLDAEGVMRFRAWRELSDDYRAAVEGHSPWESDALAPEPLLVSDAASDPTMTAYRPLFVREGIGSLAFIPLVARGRLLGKFMVYYGQAHEYGATEIETTRTIANLLGSAIARFGAIAALEDTIRNNEVFAGVLAHDLRNPLSAIVTATQLVLMRHEEEGTLSEADVKPLGKILKASHRIARMIEQLLDFTRARSGGGIVVQPRDADLSELCVQAIGELELAHPEWTIRREVVGDPRGQWDQDRLLQVISNLIANAGQHGRSGGTVLVRLDGTQPTHVRCEVHNEGSVPQALLPEIFDPFRGTRPRQGKSNGLGLGLYIVREIIRAHGGTVEVASGEATGTTFSIRLPRQKARERIQTRP